MRSGTSPDDGKKRPDDGDKQKPGRADGTKSEPAADGAVDLTESGFGTAAKRVVPEWLKQALAAEAHIKKPTTPEELAHEQDLEIETNLKARQMGLVPVDRSQMVEGPPVTAEDRAMFLRVWLDAEPNLKEAWKLVLRNTRLYSNWDDAWREVISEATGVNIRHPG